HLPDIIQLVSVSGKTGVFHLADRAHRGEIWLFEGRIVHAEVDDLAGEEAVYALAIWRSGEFRFEPGNAPPRQTIQKSNTGLLMEAARRLDEWRVLSKKIPSVELVPEFVILENREGQINLNTMEWLLLSKIDGQRTVKQIASAAGMSVFDAAKLLYGLVATSLIRLKDAGPAVAPAAAPGGATAATGVTQTPAAAGRPQTPPSAGSATAGAARHAAAATASPSTQAARAASPASVAPAASATAAAALLARLGTVRDECVALLGPVGESVVQKHYLRARAELEHGAGPTAIDEAVQQIARAAGILKGSAVAEAVLRLLKA
ncbi:MAG: DUF4388 domain-containing protein, partial [Betaproteobacteria bacterium]